MRFADLDGTPIDVVPAEHAHERRGGLRPIRRPSTRSSTTPSGRCGYFGAFGTNIHTDNSGAARGPRSRSSQSAQARGVPADLVQADAELGRWRGTAPPSAVSAGTRVPSPSPRPSVPVQTVFRRCFPHAGPDRDAERAHLRRIAAGLHAPDDQGHLSTRCSTDQPERARRPTRRRSDLDRLARISLDFRPVVGPARMARLDACVIVRAWPQRRGRGTRAARRCDASCLRRWRLVCWPWR